MFNRLVIITGKIVHSITQLFHLGAGGTWPGEVVLKLNPQILPSFLEQIKKGIIIVAGTNGKTTTSLMIKQILEKNGQQIIHNNTGANLINGTVSSLIIKSNWMGKIHADWGVFEVDENSLSLFLKDIQTSNLETRTVIVLLNLFRDQLDRYGEVDVIVEKWQTALINLIKDKDHRIKSDDDKVNDTTLILNADDPAIAYLGKNLSLQKKYFGINEPQKFLQNLEHAQDSTFCLNCGARLLYEGIYFSHLGIWKCDKCGNTRPEPQLTKWDEVLPGLYNIYNTLASVSTAKAIGIADSQIKKGLKDFKPAFGRQEEFTINNKKVKIFLSKNPAGFNASLRTVLELNPKTILLALNDRIPDGRDISWIWDVDFETIPESMQVIVSGDRAYDMGLRMKYAFRNQISNSKNQKHILNFKKNHLIESELKKAIEAGLNKVNPNETLFVLATYSAMLEVRRILGGKAIL